MEWVSVKDRLPEIGQVVMLYITYPKGTMFKMVAYPLKGKTNIRIGGLNFEGKFISYEDQLDIEGIKWVTHWMPLPKHPEE